MRRCASSARTSNATSASPRAFDRSLHATLPAMRKRPKVRPVLLALPEPGAPTEAAPTPTQGNDNEAVPEEPAHSGVGHDRTHSEEETHHGNRNPSEHRDP